MELSKRYTFLELVVGAVHAHLMFFRNGSDLLGRLEGPINDALQIGEHLRQEEGQRKVGRGGERGLEGGVCVWFLCLHVSWWKGRLQDLVYIKRGGWHGVALVKQWCFAGLRCEHWGSMGHQPGHVCPKHTGRDGAVRNTSASSTQDSPCNFRAKGEGT